MKNIIIDLPKTVPDDQWPLIAFLTKLQAQNRSYTGYKEVINAGIDLERFLTVTNTTVNSRGGIKLDQEPNSHLSFSGSLDKDRYLLDTDIFCFETDVVDAFKRRDPIWFTPYEDVLEYDEELFKKLPEKLQRWFLKKLKKGINTTAQSLLEATYDKYVVRKEPFVSAFK